MDFSNLAMGGSPKALLRKAQELERLSKIRFDPSIFGLGEVCKWVLCFELACIQLRTEFDRNAGVRITGLSEKAYIRALTNLQNALGLKVAVDVRELAVQFGCVRLVSSVLKALMEYKQRFLAGLPESRKSYADFSRGVFVAVAFYFCAKRNKVKVDKLRLIEICGTSESEFASVSSSMLNLCYDLLGLEREKIESPSAANVKTAKVCPSKRKKLDYASYVGGLDLPEDQVSEISQLLKRSRGDCEEGCLL